MIIQELLALHEAHKVGDRVQTSQGAGKITRIKGPRVSVKLDGLDDVGDFDLGDVRKPKVNFKKRDPNWETMQAKRQSGAMGKHKDPKRELALGRAKHKGRLGEELLEEAAKNMYQVKIEGSEWKELELYADDLESMSDALETADHTKAYEKFDQSQLTEIVEDYIGTSPYGMGDGWDEMDFEVMSLKNDVLKIRYTFAGVYKAHKNDKYLTDLKKTGVITIMPGN